MIERKKILGAYAVLSVHFSREENIVYCPRGMSTVDGTPIQDGMTVLVWRFPVLRRHSILKLRVKTHNENVIRIPAKYITSLDGDYDGDCVACMVIPDKYVFDWKDPIRTYKQVKIKNTTIDMSMSNMKKSKRASSFVDALFNLNREEWDVRYSDAVLRKNLNENLPKLPGMMFKRLINLQIGKYTEKHRNILYDNQYITSYNNKFSKSDIWITSVQETLNVFYSETLKLKHPNVNLNLDDIYRLHELLFDEEPTWFIKQFGIDYVNKNMDVDYYYKKYFNSAFLKSCFDVVLHGVRYA